MKRLFDIVASGCGLLALRPLLLVVAIWIKLDSRVPVFYRQVRVGYKNKDFRIFKFRSMRVGSELLILNRIDILVLASKADKNRYS